MFLLIVMLYFKQCIGDDCFLDGCSGMVAFILLTFNKSKKTASQMVASRMAASLMTSSRMAAFWMVVSDLQSLQNSLRRNWMLKQPLLFNYQLPKHLVFFYSPQRRQLGHLQSVSYLPLIVLPTQPLPRETEDFRRVERHFKHASPLIYLIYLLPKGVFYIGSFYLCA